jgi:hypothetical protein
MSNQETISPVPSKQLMPIDEANTPCWQQQPPQVERRPPGTENDAYWVLVSEPGGYFSAELRSSGDGQRLLVTCPYATRAAVLNLLDQVECDFLNVPTKHGRLALLDKTA